MSDDRKDPREVAEPRPLRTMLKDSDLETEARLLGQALQDMHDAPVDDKPPAWSAIEEQALRLARRRRWRYHLGEAWRGSWPLQLAAATAGHRRAGAAFDLVFSTRSAERRGPRVGNSRR